MQNTFILQQQIINKNAVLLNKRAIDRELWEFMFVLMNIP